LNAHTRAHTHKEAHARNGVGECTRNHDSLKECNQDSFIWDLTPNRTRAEDFVFGVDLLKFEGGAAPQSLTLGLARKMVLLPSPAIALGRHPPCRHPAHRRAQRE